MLFKYFHRRRVNFNERMNYIFIATVSLGKYKISIKTTPLNQCCRFHYNILWTSHNNYNCCIMVSRWRGHVHRMAGVPKQRVNSAFRFGGVSRNTKIYIQFFFLFKYNNKTFFNAIVIDEIILLSYILYLSGRFSVAHRIYSPVEWKINIVRKYDCTLYSKIGRDPTETTKLR